MQYVLLPVHVFIVVVKSKKSLDVMNDKSPPVSVMKGLECCGSSLKYGSSYEGVGSEVTDGTAAPGNVFSAGAVFEKSTFLCPNTDNYHKPVVSK